MTRRPEPDAAALLWLVAALVFSTGTEAAAQIAGPVYVAPAPLGSGWAPEYAAPAGRTPPMAIGPAPYSAVPGYSIAPGYPVAPIYPAGPGYPAAQMPVLTPGSPAGGRAVLVGPPAYFVTPGFAGPSSPLPQPAPHVAYSAPLPTGAELAPLVAPRRVTGPANFDLAVSEEFLNRVISRERLDPGPVQDVILGAQVTGQQMTRSRLRADLRPSYENGRIALLLNGNVQSLTTGVTPQAMIDTASQQQFHAVKEVYFDGTQFSTRHATVFIRAQNQTLGATTPLAGTLFGDVANRIAYRAAERQKSAGEAAARDRLAERLFPTFDGEVDANLARLNRQIAPIRQRLSNAKLLPDSQSVWSDDQHLHYQFLMGDGGRTAPVPEFAESPAGLRASYHESLLNELVDRAGLRGYKTTDKKLRDLENRVIGVFGGVPRPPKRPNGLPLTGDVETDIEFDEVDPIRFRFEQDQFIVILKAHFKPAGQNLVPPMIVTIPFEHEISGTRIRWKAQSPRVVAQDRPDPTAPPTLMESAVQKILEADLEPIEFERTLPASLWPVEHSAPAIQSLRMADGWMTVQIQ